MVCYVILCRVMVWYGTGLRNEMGVSGRYGMCLHNGIGVLDGGRERGRGGWGVVTHQNGLHPLDDRVGEGAEHAEKDDVDQVQQEQRHGLNGPVRYQPCAIENTSNITTDDARDKKEARVNKKEN